MPGCGIVQAIRPLLHDIGRLGVLASAAAVISRVTTALRKNEKEPEPLQGKPRLEL